MFNEGLCSLQAEGCHDSMWVSKWSFTLATVKK